MKTVEEAIQPYIERYKHLNKQELMSMGGGDCGCMGPMGDNPLCRCKLAAKAQEFLLDKWYRENA